MVKEPRSGRVKTRLGRSVGMTTAAWWFRHQVNSLIHRLTDPRWDIILAVTPDTAGLTSRVWPGHLRRVPQGTGTLGDRMARVLSVPASGPVCVIGADIPGITKRHIARGFSALGNHDVVFGPAPDGGYWLVGLKNNRPAPPTLFQRVRWSGPHALADSVTSLKDRRVTYIDCLQDVDTVEDLRMTQHRARAT